MKIITICRPCHKTCMFLDWINYLNLNCLIKINAWVKLDNRQPFGDLPYLLKLIWICGFFSCSRFDFSNSYIWFEFYNALLPKDVTLISDVSSCSLFFFSNGRIDHTIKKRSTYQTKLMFTQDVATSLFIILVGSTFLAYCWAPWWLQFYEYAG